MNAEIQEIVKFRLLKRIEKIREPLIKLFDEKFEFIIAGNSLNKNVPNDFDLYANNESEFHFEKITDYVKNHNGEVISETRNALTVKLCDTVVQFCKYKKHNLRELVDSFDFAHIQIGASFVIMNKSLNLTEVYYSYEWEKSRLLETTYYTKPSLKSSYPLASLIRCFKYKERGDFGDRSYIVSVLDILNQIVSRGYKSYDDFKDQMAAVDLQLLEKDESNAAWRLYQTLGENGLVYNYNRKEDIDEDGEEY